MGTVARAGAGLHGWWVLAVIGAANMLVAVAHFGLAAAAPLLRDELALSTGQLGVLLAAVPAGLVLGTFGWGVLADRIGERRVLAGGFAGWSACILAAALAVRASFGAGADERAAPTVVFGAMLLLAGLFGSSAYSAGGRALTAAFPAQRHGLILAIRHTAIPVGATIGGLLVPLGLQTVGPGAVFGGLSVLGLVAAASLARIVRDSPTHDEHDGLPIASTSASPLRVPHLWLLGGSCSMLAFTQLGLASFLTIQLVDEAGFAVGVAAATFAAAQLAGAGARILVGVASDRAGWRIRTLVVVAGVATATVAATLVGPDRVDGILLACALFVTTSWNGAAVAAAASLAPAGRTGASLGMQTTMFATMGVVAPVAIGWLLESHGWDSVSLVLVATLTAATAGLGALHTRYPS